MGELWGVYCEDFEENGPHYNCTALYIPVHCNIFTVLIWIILHNIVQLSTALTENLVASGGIRFIIDLKWYKYLVQWYNKINTTTATFLLISGNLRGQSNISPMVTE